MGFINSCNCQMTRLPKRTFRRAMPTIVLAVPAHASSAEAPADRLQQVVQPYVNAQMFMGSVLVAKDGKVVFSKSYGMADLEWSVPNSPTTII
jgi:D-alanyl-D-alanine carboxypeptidase